MRKTVILDLEIEELKKIFTDDRPENCEGVLGYEEPAVGDGVLSEYFDNEDFMGVPLKTEDLDINFDW